jgi:outer membrane protein assembly factor BamB
LDWKQQVVDSRGIRSLHLPESRPLSLYAETDDRKIHAFDPAIGVYQWITPIGVSLQAPPCATEQSLYLVGGHMLLSIDIAPREPPARPSGILKWRLPLDFAPSGRPAAGGRTEELPHDPFVAIAALTNALHVIPVKTLDEAMADVERGSRKYLPIYRGLKQWHFQTTAPITAAPIVPPAGERDAVIFATEEGIVRKRSLKAFQDTPYTGWDFPGRGGRIGPVRADPVYHEATIDPAGGKSEGYCYVGGSDDHTLYILRVRDGYLQAKMVLGGPIESPPVISGADPAKMRIYVACAGDGLYCLDIPEPEWQRLTRRIYSKTAGGEWTNEQGEIEVHIENFPLWPLRVRWKAAGVDRFLMEGRRAAYLLDSRGKRILAIEREGGSILGELPVPSADFLVGTPPGSSEGRIFLATRNGEIYAYKEKP